MGISPLKFQIPPTENYPKHTKMHQIHPQDMWFAPRTQSLLSLEFILRVRVLLVSDICHNSFSQGLRLLSCIFGLLWVHIAWYSNCVKTQKCHTLILSTIISTSKDLPNSRSWQQVHRARWFNARFGHQSQSTLNWDKSKVHWIIYNSFVFEGSRISTAIFWWSILACGKKHPKHSLLTYSGRTSHWPMR